jgi:ribosomal-protein-alanine N-acetyltransferase
MMMMPTWAIRPARTDEDLDAVLRIEDESFTNPWTREMYAAEFAHSDVAHVDVALDSAGAPADAVIIGFCSYWNVVDEVHLNNVAVTPRYRHRGVATALLRHVIAQARTHRCRRILLEVRRSNAVARRLYEHLGFQSTGVRPAYYTQPTEDALVLTLELS